MTRIEKVLVVGNNPAVERIFAAKGYKIVQFNNHIPDLVVFTGGPDINPELYQESALPRTNFTRRRDREDLYYFNKFKELPKIGICRGAQFLNVMNGGSLWQHVDNHTNEHDAIDLLITKTPVRVTSTHHQMMIPGELGEVLAIANEAKTFLSARKREKPMFDTEVVWYDNAKTLCFQPHPEYTNLSTKSPYQCRQYFFDLIDYLYRL